MSSERSFVDMIWTPSKLTFICCAATFTATACQSPPEKRPL